MAWSFYAVRKGTRTGVVTSWAECQEMVKGVSGADFKGFNDEDQAIKYVKTGEISVKSGIVISKPSTGGLANVYARGTVRDNGAYIGVVIEGCDKRYQFFGEIVVTDTVKSKGFVGELLAVLVATQLSLDLGFTQLNFVFAYDGVEKWFNGDWAARDSLAVGYSTLMNKLRLSGCLNYTFTRGVKGIKGVVLAERLISRAKNMHQYIDSGKTLGGNLKVQDVPLFTIS